MKSCKALLAHTEEDLLEAMQRDKKELRDKIESESGDVKRKMELECNEMRDRLQGGNSIDISSVPECGPKPGPCHFGVLRHVLTSSALELK